MKAIIWGALVSSALFAAPAAAQSLTLDQVVSLSNAGLGDDAVIAKIKSSQTHIDLTTDQMLSLKSQGVSGPIIAAMLAVPTTAAAPPMSLDALDPSLPHPSGVYLVGNDKLMRIDATASNQAKTGGIFGYALTGGIASMSVKASINNAQAKVRGTSKRPSFYFFFDEANGDRSNSAWQAGTAATVTSPSEFSLVRLIEKKGRREARVGSMNIGGAKTGVMDKDRIAFSYELVRPGVYKVTPDTPLEAGEYGFLFSLTGGNGGGALTARVFDFGVD